MNNKHQVNWQLLLLGVGLGFVITIGSLGAFIFIYDKNSSISWNKEIISGKSLFNWVYVSTFPVSVLVLGYQLQKINKDNNEKQVHLEKQIIHNNLFEENIQSYLKNISLLLLSDKYRPGLFGSEPDEENSTVTTIQILTVSVLRKLEINKDSQKKIINFLREVDLHQLIFINADLSKIDLEEADLSSLNLEGANLERANLRKANLSRSNLKEAWIDEADLREADLREANLKGTRLKQANLQQANISKANLERAYLKKANLLEANLENSNLTQVNLSEANLTRAKLIEVNLKTYV